MSAPKMTPGKPSGPFRRGDSPEAETARFKRAEVQASVWDNIPSKPPSVGSPAEKDVAEIQKLTAYDHADERIQARMLGPVRRLTNLVNNPDLDGREHVATLLANLRNSEHFPYLKSYIPAIRESAFRASLTRLTEENLSARELDQWFHALGRIMHHIGAARVNRNTKGNKAANAARDTNDETAALAKDGVPTESEADKKAEQKAKAKVITFHDHSKLQEALRDSRLSEGEFTTLFVKAHSAGSFDDFVNAFASVPDDNIWATFFAIARSNTEQPQHFDYTNLTTSIRQTTLGSEERFKQVVEDTKEAKDFRAYQGMLNNDKLLRDHTEAALYAITKAARL